MEKISNILVGLDLSDIDETLIEYSAYLADLFNAEKVYFVHNIKKYEISELFQEQLKDLNLEEVIGEDLNEKIESKFDSKRKWEVLTSEDPYTEALIKYTVNKYFIQLVILGNKNQQKGTGVLSSKLLRLLNCDLLTIPRNFRPAIDNIWAGTDFSKQSRKALHIAMMLQKNTEADVSLVHVYSFPVHFSPYIPKEDMQPKIEKHANERMKKFLQHLGEEETITPLIFSAQDSSEAWQLARKAENSHVDMLIVTDTGGSTISSILVGSLTEELFNEKLQLPLWIVK